VCCVAKCQGLAFFRFAVSLAHGSPLGWAAPLLGAGYLSQGPG
jgi:hypothetical protein